MPETQKITSNKGRCRLCGDVIESKHRHDFRWCKCGKVAVDGGHEYLRRVGDVENLEELSEYEYTSNFAENRKKGIYE